MVCPIHTLFSAALYLATLLTSITLGRAEGVQETILRQNIDQITSTGKSIMPEGLELNITVPQMADLLTFLLRPQ